MAPDRIAEFALIELSRLPRETLERWARVTATAGEHDTAEELRAELARRDQMAQLRRAA